MQRTNGLIMGIVLAVMAYGSVGFAQEAKHAPLMGKVTLQSGKTLEGDLLLVAFGVTEAARFGSDPREVDEGGKVELLVGGETKTIAGRDIAAVQAEWKLAPRAPGGEPEWHITSLAVTTRDGQTVTGTPSWFMSMSELFLQPGGSEARVHIENYPLFRSTFDPDNLMVKVEVTGAAPPGATAPTPGPTEMPPVPPVPAAPVVEAPPAEPPVVVTPTERLVPELPPVTAPPVPAARAPAETAPEPKPVSVTLTIICPHCGEKIVVSIAAHAQ